MVTTAEQVFSQPTAVVRQAVPEGPPVRVLVADDDPAIRSLVRGVFTVSPCCSGCVEAEDAEDVFAALEASPPDVILLRSALAGMNGLQVTRSIMVRHPVPVVIMADQAEEDMDRAFECLRSGALDIVTRTEAGLSLPETVTRVVSLARQVRALQKRQDVPEARPDVSALPVQALFLLAGTGALGAALRVWQGCAPSFSVPVVLVTALAPSLLPGFVRWLDDTLEEGALLADLNTGQPLKVGPLNVVAASALPRVVASGDRGLILAGLPEGPWSASHVSSGENGFDVLLASLAEVAPEETVKETAAVLLGGLHSSGAAGLSLLKRARGRTFVELPALCPFAQSSFTAVRIGAADVYANVSSLVALLDGLGASQAESGA
ncbi:response regulator [Acetobacter sp.]|jgi:chemotaxis response regulator CheB|uniref:response regulator n=1 Tax=Acetobacter sp. TaxID=440 RepID=UPI0025BE7568|nr:response regulator [Acetobacter sp.]MCH4090044.1 response regulator [Acetobacter sp.]MCI1298740.1 response regulator [Acetobacter sp.]MCI1315305.1 response regulator [Acetobacter sp.]